MLHVRLLAAICLIKVQVEVWNRLTVIRILKLQLPLVTVPLVLLTHTFNGFEAAWKKMHLCVLNSASCKQSNFLNFKNMQLDVHRLRFGNWVPSAIKSIAVDPLAPHIVAVGRVDGDIEVSQECGR